MKKQVAVVIPYYRNELSETERMAYRQCIKVLSGYPIILIVPDSIKVSKAVLVPGIKMVKVPSKWMQSIETYNQMMLNADFYRMERNILKRKGTVEGTLVMGDFL